MTLLAHHPAKTAAVTLPIEMKPPLDKPFGYEGSREMVAYAKTLLNKLGCSVVQDHQSPLHSKVTMEAASVESVESLWQRSGLQALTGNAEDPPIPCPLPIANYADAVILAIRALCPEKLPADLSGANLLTERAKILGLKCQGSISAGGSCRILPTSDGHIAVNFAREADWEQLDAWLEQNLSRDWPAVANAVLHSSTNAIVEQGHLLGLAVANANPGCSPMLDWYELAYSSKSNSTADTPDIITTIKSNPRVIDLSSLWAGPLCSHLLQLTGADVVKVESSQRPDGTRLGSTAFFNRLNEGKQYLNLELHKQHGRDQLRELILSADIVIEGSRPRALRQMGIDAESIMKAQPRLTWISITGYGRNEPEANWVAYGDDAAVAAGLSQLIHGQTGRWLFCGDAIADPLTGMHAALAALASVRAGGGHLLSLSLHQTVRHCLTFAGQAPFKQTQHAR